MPQSVTGQYVCCKYQGKDLGLGYRGERTCFYDENNPAWCVFVGYERYCSRCLDDYTDAGILRLDGII